MSQRRTSIQVGYEPVPGYVLRKRLGAGGYGEVWLADAPGGLQKAIKLIYGTVDESHATSELRSLQRIRQVYHPFLLSIERIEIVANQVVIITELAESSLLDRFEQWRRKGAPGIPRATLLDFMRDTADALDFLAQKHALQHLDVKPGNLLIIADRIKVADFGLIKDLRDQNQSLVSGLTPTYSAPEIFDGRPDYRSDQYSLSIVYMEMLTGQLPYDGRSTGELARQHINQAPNLDALPPADRPVVLRALSKNPLDRFSTCRIFVEQLLKTRSAVVPLSTLRATDKDTNDSQQPSTVGTQPSPTLLGARAFTSAINIEELASTWVNPRSMFIGLGGVGCKSLVALRAAASRDCDCRFSVDDLGWLAIDTNLAPLNEITEEGPDQGLPAKCAMQLPIYKPSEYRDAEPDLFTPISRRWLYNIPRSLSTEGVRPLAILAFLDHYKQLKAKLSSELRDLVEKQNRDEECLEPIRIYVLSSLHGGTGSGLLLEIGSIVRRIMAELRYGNYRISAVVSAATTTNSQPANLAAAAAIASLSELSYSMNPNYEVPGIYFGDRDVPSSTRPFDWISIVDGGLHGNQQDLASACANIANATWLDAQTLSGAALNESRISLASTQHGWARTVATKPIQISSNISAQSLARWCCDQTLHHALKYMTGPRGVATSLTSSPTRDSGGMPTDSGDLPLTDNACKEFTRRLLADLGLSVHAADLNLSIDPNFAHQWTRRLSNSQELHAAQLSADIATWKTSIAKIVQMRVYNWKQVEQIQLRCVEGILDYCENQTEDLVKKFEPYAKLIGSPENMRKSAVQYLRRFSEECVQLLDHFQSGGKSLSLRINSWCNSLGAEKKFNESMSDVSLSGLPPRLQLLASRVNAVLESTVHRLALQVLYESELSLKVDPIENTRLGDKENVNLNYMLKLTSDLLARIANEIGIHGEDFNSEHVEGVNLGEIEKFVPVLAMGCRELTRMVVAPLEQNTIVEQKMKDRNLTAQTTLIPSTRSLGSHILCDAAGVSLRQLITSLWRPSPTTLQLAERLRTRVDVEWEPSTILLDADESETGHADAPEVAINPISVDPNTGTMQIQLNH